MSIYRTEDNNSKNLGSDKATSSQPNLINLNKVRLQKIYNLLAHVTTNQKILDFFWFDPCIVFNKIVKYELYTGIWVEGVYVHMTPSSEIILSNKLVRLTINSPTDELTSITFNQEKVTLDLIREGLLPILFALADMSGYDYTVETPTVDTEQPESVKSDTVVESNDDKPSKSPILATVGRPGIGRKKSLDSIKALVRPYVSEPRLVSVLDMRVIDLYTKLMDKDLRELKINNVLFKMESKPMGMFGNHIHITIATQKWVVDIITSSKSKVKLYNSFAYTDSNDVDELKAIADVLTAINLIV